MVANRTKSARLQELAERRTGKDRRQTARRAVDAAKTAPASVFLPKPATESSAIPNRRLRGKRRKTSRRGASQS